LLGEGGQDNLTVASLCDRLGVSKGSFYHHFDDMNAFVDRFAAAWGAWMEQLFVQLGEAADPRRRLEFAANEAFVVMSPAVQAMRAWGRTNPRIAEAFTSPERTWWKTAVGTFADVAEDEVSGQIITTMNNAVSIGFLTRPRRLERERYVRLLALLYRSYGVGTDLARCDGRAQLEVLSWDRSQVRRLDPDPLPTPDVPVTPATAPTIRGHTQGPVCGKDDYYLAATELLGEQGPGAVTVTGLARKLGVSTGSFQHHFGSQAHFVESYVADRLRTENAEIRSFARERNPLRRMEFLLSEMLIGPDPAETAWRAWGHTNPVVGAAIRRLDKLREQALAEAIGQSVPGLDSAATAELTLGFALGLRREAPPFGQELRTRTALEWMRRVLGVDAALRTEDGLPRLTVSPA
jgi:AcrR family transcriptional regulator